MCVKCVYVCAYVCVCVCMCVYVRISSDVMADTHASTFFWKMVLPMWSEVNDARAAVLCVLGSAAGPARNGDRTGGGRRGGRAFLSQRCTRPRGREGEGGERIRMGGAAAAAAGRGGGRQPPPAQRASPENNAAPQRCGPRARRTPAHSMLIPAKRQIASHIACPCQQHCPAARSQAATAAMSPARPPTSRLTT